MECSLLLTLPQSEARTLLSQSETYNLSLLVLALGVLVILLVIWFGMRVLQAEEDLFSRAYYDAMRAYWGASPAGARPILPRLAVEALAERLQRRNEWWSSYGQIVTAVLIIVVLTADWGH